jgi:protein TonB
MASSRSVVMDVSGTIPPATTEYVAAASKTDVAKAADLPVVKAPVPAPAAGDGTPADREVKTDEPGPAVAQNTKPAYVPTAPPVVKEEPKPAIEQPAAQPEAPKPAPAETGPMDVGPLLAYATRQMSPIVPAMAKSMGARGIVRVDVVVDESGDVTEVEKATGPMMLQGAAKDAIKRWKFKPFVRDGQPVKATGFVNFNFNL